jgi:transcriptional regulator with XRE-family HTH domain
MDLEDERYLLLIDQVCEDHRIDIERHGGETAVARLLGVHVSTVHKIREGERGAGEDTRDKAAKALGFNARFFKVRSLGDRPRYSDWKHETGMESDDPVDPEISAYFREHQSFARFMPRVVRELHAHKGKITRAMIKRAVRRCEDEEDARRQ